VILKKLLIPKPSIPKHIEGYNFPETNKNLLTWEFLTTQMSNAKHYWITTSSKSGILHSVPVWGIWFKDRVFVGGSPKTKWVRNLQKYPDVTIHLPSPIQVCMIEGKAIILEDDDIDAKEWELLDSQYHKKYQQFHGSPYIFIEPIKILAWDSETLDHMTIWVFK
jgi:hypothetical protein